MRWGLLVLLSLVLASPAWADQGTTTTTGTTTVATPTTTTTTTTAATTTAAAPPPVSFTSTRAPLATGCPAAAVVVVYPKQMPLFLSPPAGKALLQTPSGVTASVARVDMADCIGDVMLRSLSLFDSIQAQQVKLDGTTPSVVGLQVGSSAAVGRRFPLGWGTLVVGDVEPTYVAALSLTLSREHEGMPAGTQILVGVGPVPPKPKVVPHAKKIHKHKSKKATHQPLKITPRLQVKKFVFPLVGSWGVGDSYGGPRSDVPGNWHHGDDLFAPIGTPVVAVANGTVNRVGWEKIGGWRLWVRDTAGDQFYYAHLSGYAPAVLKSKKVTRGEVIAFVGNTGDAFTTPSHLHFEIHPRKLLHLGYDGAVDPTTYLERWPHVLTAAAPRPVHPQLPRAPQPHYEATYVWHELLMARHLIVSHPKHDTVVLPKPLDAGSVAVEASAPVGRPSAGSSSTWLVIAAAAGLVLLLGLGGGFAYRRRT